MTFDLYWKIKVIGGGVCISIMLAVLIRDLVVQYLEKRKLSKMQQQERAAYLIEKYGRDWQEHL